MGRTILLWLVLSAVFPTALSAQDNPAQAVDRGVSRAYYRGARELFEQGDLRSAEQFLRTASEFQATDSDILYLRALIAARRQETGSQALEFVERAVSADRWTDYSDLDGRLLLSQLLLRFRRHEEVLVALSTVDETPLPATALFLLARAYAGLGDRSEARSAADRGMLLYPDDVRFSRVLLELDDSPGFRWGQWLRQHTSDNEHILASLLYYAGRQPVEAEQREIIELYRRYGGRDPLSVILDPAAGDRDSIDEFTSLGGFDDLYLIRRLYAVASARPSREVLDARIAELSGWVSGDQDRDGFWEVRGLYQSGILRRFESDRDQNGVPEVSLLTDGLVPLEVIERETGIVTPDGETADWMRVVYSSYPFVSRVEFRRDATDTVYHLVPRRVRYPVIDIPIQPDTSLPHILIPLTVEPALLRLDTVAAFTYRRTIATDTMLQIESFYDGVLYLTEYDRNADGIVDHLVEYENGRPVSGLRDISGNGTFDLVEQYADGVLSRLLLDSNLDGIPEFVTILGDARRLSWDYDEDGIIDADELLEGRERTLNLRTGRNGEEIE